MPRDTIVFCYMDVSNCLPDIHISTHIPVLLSVLFQEVSFAVVASQVLAGSDYECSFIGLTE